MDKDLKEQSLRYLIHAKLEAFALSELEVVLFLVKRLEKGRVEYGVLEPDSGREWLTELAEELADGIVYISAHLQRESGQRLV